MLARQALAGSQVAYSALVSRYAAPAIAFATRLVRDRAVAEELAQDAFVKAFRSLETYDQGRPFSSWFFRVLHNVTIDHLRVRRVEAASLDAHIEAGRPEPAQSLDDAPDAEVERRQLAASLDSALGGLRPAFRSVVALRYQQGLSLEEIGEVLNLPVGTVKTHLHRARKELASVLAAEGWGPGQGST